MKTEEIKELKAQNKQYEIYDTSFKGLGSFGIRVNPSGKKSFFYIYKIAKKRKRITIGAFPQTSLLEAKEIAEITSNDITEGKDPASEKTHWKRPELFKDVRDFFLVDLQSKGRKEKTIKEYQRIFGSYLSYLNDRHIKTISAEEINYLLLKHSETPVMQKRISALLSTFFNFSVKELLISSSPAESVDLTIEISRTPFEALNIKSIQNIWANSSNLKPLHKAIFRLLILTGQRPKEVTNLRWRDIQLGSWELGKTNRNLPISPLMNEVLKELKNSGHSSNDYLFPSSKGLHIKHLQRACTKLNNLSLTNTSFSPGSFRKSFRSLLLKEKFKTHVVDEILGSPSFIRAELTEIETTLTKWSHLASGFRVSKPKDLKSKHGKVIKLYDIS